MECLPFSTLHYNKCLKPNRAIPADKQLGLNIFPYPWILRIEVHAPVVSFDILTIVLMCKNNVTFCSFKCLLSPPWMESPVGTVTFPGK